MWRRPIMGQTVLVSMACTDADPAPRPVRGEVALRALAWVLLALTLAAVMVAVVTLVASGLPWRTLFPTYAVTNAWMALAFAPFGAVVALRRPRLAIGWLFVAYALCYGVSAAMLGVSLQRYAAGSSDAVSSAIGWIGASIWTPAIALCLPLAILLFPDDRLASRRWRLLVYVCVANTVVWPVVWALDPRQVPINFYVTEPPVVLHGRVGNVVNVADTVANVSVSLAVLAALVSMMIRRRRSTGRQRDQLSWLLWGIGVAVVLFAPTAANVQTVWSTMLLTGIIVLPAAAAVALLRYRLFDIDLVINRTFVYVALTASLIGGYLLVVQAVAAVLGQGLGSSLVATAVVAVVFGPARHWLQRRVDVLLYGLRNDPVHALSSVAASLEGPEGHELEVAVAAVRDSLRLPQVLVDVDGRRIGEDRGLGVPAGEIVLRYRGRTVGRMLYWARRGQASLSRSDQAALSLVAAPLAAAVHIVGLGADLRRSQQRLITARAEERQRLYRDLHDGLGPALTAVALKADAAGNLVTDDPGAAGRLIDQAATEARTAIGEVRRIAHDLRPADLEDVDLPTALAHEAARFTRRLDGQPLATTVDVPADMPRLDPAVEVAAYRITAEALTNAARHSTAARVTVRLSIDSVVRLDIVDDGTSPSASWPNGFGLTSMRRRAAELGGTFEARPTRDGGRVAVTLPLALARASS
jgi:two-component system NarL family sensor kinase